MTNAEWACFMVAGGYDDEQWWDTEVGRAWRRGDLGNEAAKANNRMWRRNYLEHPGLFDQKVDAGQAGGSDESIERWRGWLKLSDAAFEAALEMHWQAIRLTEPSFWRDARFNHLTQPVVGVCWYEARAYCAWLSAQTELEVRLPTEVEWEAAARGTEGRQYAYGDAVDRLAANTVETHVQRTTPVGVFPSGATPDGMDDLGGQVGEWTSSLDCEGEDDEWGNTQFPYPYDSADGREDADAGPSVRRVVRGGAWNDTHSVACAALRRSNRPDDRGDELGLRVVVVSSPMS